MKKLFLLFILIFLSNCSFNDNSKFWTEDVIVKKNYENQLNKILDKSNNLMSLTINEFEIYINEYNNKSKYPDLNK